ncbi:MAG: glycerol-3-phosphate 1-O-acyltransferase PlsY [Armatimonadota bacterium]
MHEAILAVAGALTAYLIGGIPFGLLVCRWWSGYDPRDYGSGNIGATNVYRLLGPKGFAAVLLLDAGKGYTAVLAGRLVATSGSHWITVMCAVCTILGANWSVYLKFRGGKGVGVSLGAGTAVMWKVTLLALAVWIVVVAATRYVSLSSMAAAVSVPVLAVVLNEPLPHRVFGAVLAVFILVRHVSNIRRLLAGTEPKFGARIDTTRLRESSEHQR